MANVEVATIPVIPERRSRATLEVIDVDLIDDDDLPQRPSQRRRLSHNPERRPRVPTPETILVIDSDDEPDTSSSTNPPQRVNRQRIFSPPPPPQDTTIPPVPAIPPRFFLPPMRRLPPPFPSAQPLPDVVRAIERPLEFEPVADVELNLPHRPLERHSPFPAPAPPSHHVPAMGLGGALLSHHRRQIAADQHAHRRRAARERALERARAQDFIPDDYYRLTMRTLTGGTTGGTARAGRTWTRDYDAILAHILASQNPPDIVYFPGRSEPQEPDYLPSYSHPVKHLPGFTADFGPSQSPPPPTPAVSSQNIIIVDSPVASTSSTPPDDAVPLIVCAQCLDPLFLENGADPRNRIWGLRCGHVIDGKCMELIMKPHTAVLEDTPVDTPKPDPDQPIVETDDKASGSIRSRLRSFDATQPTPGQQPTRSRRRRNILTLWWRGDDENDTVDLHPRGKRNKGKNKVVEPVVEATHEWTCPLPSCAKVHVSLLIEGKWTMDKERGAIGIYA